MADDDAPSARHADTCTITTILQLRDILEETQKTLDIPIIPEIMDTAACKWCDVVRAPDFIDSSVLPSRMLAMIAFRHRMSDVLAELTSPDARVIFSIEKLTDYLLPGEDMPESLNFFEATTMVGRTNDILLSWTVQSEEEAEAEKDEESKKAGFLRLMSEIQISVQPEVRMQTWMLNPEDKLESRVWAEHDRICVLTPRKPDDLTPKGIKRAPSRSK
eukprot:gnl/TRDRNA2_/TRDRNA2_122136_c3_seq1.p1 gnl/TRDRNA2_/TRDRNA2_122136_c3~~gnl/TRDRNA2_/TRDRNA2_122136_c3_seq1.p1  ORF type:complete len:244 (-),score=60.02 gnl/TRDRNA2_/TRDRNA2_122136_c3_seq1:54-707(-)